MKKISKTNAIYIAGFFDGEGCVHSGISKGYPHIILEIGQRDLSILKWITETVGFGTPHKRSDGAYQLRITGKTNIKKFIEIILPYAKVKKLQLKLALKFLTLVGTQGGSTSLSKDNLFKRMNLHYKLKESKHVGTEQTKR